MFYIYIYMILITKLIPAVLLYPACICIFLAFFILRPVTGYIAVLNILVLLPAVTLFWSRYNAGINYLAFLGGKTVFVKKSIELIKQLFDKLCFGQLFSEQPYSLCIRDRITQRQSKEPHKAEPVSDLKFNLVIGEVIQRLQYHDFEHKDNIKGFSSRGRFSFYISYSFKRPAELFPIDYLVEFYQRVAAVVELFKTGLPVEKSCVYHMQSFVSDMKNRNLFVNELNISSVRTIARNFVNF